jgi:hypothetical protein
MVLSTSPAASYSRSQVTVGEDPFGLPRLDSCLQPHMHPTTQRWLRRSKQNSTLQIRQKTQDPNSSPKKHNHKNQQVVLL